MHNESGEPMVVDTEKPVLLRPEVFARLVSSTESTVRRWAREGRIESVKLGDTPNAGLRIPSSEVDRIIRAGRAGLERAVQSPGELR
jgi:predicted site-specific integrase-resolvase